MTSISYYHCNKCDKGGTVPLKQTRTKSGIVTLTVGKCNKCKYSFGLKGISDCKEVSNS